MERAGHVREKYDLRSGKLFAKSKAFANLTRRAVRGIESERATHVLYTPMRAAALRRRTLRALLRFTQRSQEQSALTRSQASLQPRFA